MKTISPTEDALTRSGAFRPADLIRIELPSGNVGLWFGGYGKVTHAGLDYVGTGPLLTAGAIETSSDGAINVYDLSLSGISSETLATIENEDYQQAPAIRLSAQIGADGQTLTEVRTVAVGRVSFAVRDDWPESKLTLRIEGAGEALAGDSDRRRTHLDQLRLAYPISDQFFANVSEAARRTRYWGKKAALRASGTANGIGSNGGSTGRPGLGAVDARRF